MYYYKSRVPIAFEFLSLNNRLLHQKINFTIQVDNLERVVFVTVNLEFHKSILVKWQAKNLQHASLFRFFCIVSCLKHKMTESHLHVTK